MRYGPHPGSGAAATPPPSLGIRGSPAWPRASFVLQRSRPPVAPPPEKALETGRHIGRRIGAGPRRSPKSPPGRPESTAPPRRGHRSAPSKPDRDRVRSPATADRDDPQIAPNQGNHDRDSAAAGLWGGRVGRLPREGKMPPRTVRRMASIASSIPRRAVTTSSSVMLLSRIGHGHRAGFSFDQEGRSVGSIPWRSRTRDAPIE
jgi:hypothetical protein